jgi:hypothetical protein
MQRFCDLQTRVILLYFKASRTAECTEGVMQFFDEVLAKQGYEEQSTYGAFVGPLPAHILFRGKL